MIIKNADVYTQDNVFVKGDVVVDNGTFTKVLDVHNYVGDEVVDATGLKMIPGLVDIHFHGCKGADMCDGTKEALDIISRYEASVGVTSICPATMTIAKEELVEVMKNAGEYSYNGGAHLVGINMEGPFISPQKKGAQAAENIMHCNYEYFCELQKAAHDLIKIVDIAPEEPGAMDFIDKVKDNVVVSIAHTAADYDTAMEAIQHGATHATHLYNAMRGLESREPGVLGYILDSSNIYCGIIPDGLHVHYSSISIAKKLLGDKLYMVTDAASPAGTNMTEFMFEGNLVYHKDGKCVDANGTLGGSALVMIDGVKNLIQGAKFSYEEALKMATSYPAKAIQVDSRYGHIKPGYIADLTYFDENFKVKGTISKGILERY